MGASYSDKNHTAEPKGASRRDTTTMVEEGADLVRDARGNVAAGEGLLGSAEPGISDPRPTQPNRQGQLVNGKGNAANRKDLRLVPIGKTKKGTDRQGVRTGLCIRK